MMQATCTAPTVPVDTGRSGVLARDVPAGHNEEVVRSFRLRGSFARRFGSTRRHGRGDVPRRGLHLVLCVGSVDEWAGRSEHEWAVWAEWLGATVGTEGISAITLFPVSGIGTVPPRVPPRQWSSHGVSIRASCEPDGRHRLAEVVNAWPPGLALTDETLGRALTGSAGDPDIVAVVGDPGRLPAALVWELAYAELFDIDRTWLDFTPHDLIGAIHEFRTRHRRFGGIGDGPIDEPLDRPTGRAIDGET